MTNWLNTENFNAYMEHLKKVDTEIEKQIQKKLGMNKELKKSQKLRKYLKYLVLPE